MDTYDRLCVLQSHEEVRAYDGTMTVSVVTGLRAGELRLVATGPLSRLVRVLTDTVEEYPGLAPEVPKATQWVLPLMQEAFRRSGSTTVIPGSYDLHSIPERLSITVTPSQATWFISVAGAQTVEVVR